MGFNKRVWCNTSYYPFNSVEMEIKRFHLIFTLSFYCRSRFNGYFKPDIIPILLVATICKERSACPAYAWATVPYL
jgi:hypothetical protein